jgi:hypothetical protein
VDRHRAPQEEKWQAKRKALAEAAGAVAAAGTSGTVADVAAAAGTSGTVAVNDFVF